MFSFFTDLDEIESESHSFENDNIAHKQKKKIKSRISSHGTTMLESVFDYLLPSSDTGSKKTFDVSAYFFFPPQMNININNYPPENFYRDLSPFYRLNEPKYSYKDFVGNSRKGLRSPLEIIASKLHELKDAPSFQEKYRLERQCIDYVRTFSASYVAYFLQRVSRRIKKLESTLSSPTDTSKATKIENHLTAISPLIDRSIEISKKFLNLNTHHIIGDDDPYMLKVQDEFAIAHEYCFYKLKEGISHLGAAVYSVPNQYQQESFVKLQHKFKVLARGLSIYAQHHHFYWIDAESNQQQQEAYVYRLGFLKKRIWQVFFLETKAKTAQAFQRQFSYMLAAGFAALWAFFANILILRFLPQATDENPLQGLQDLLGVSGLLLLTMSIFAYILKDRIKEVGRSSLYRAFFRNQPDYEENVYQRRFDNSTIVIGQVREWLNYTGAKYSIPDEITKIRHSVLKQKPLLGESALHYHKQLIMDQSRLDLGDMPIAGLKDVLRFDLSHFIQQLANPTEIQVFLSRNGKILEASVPRVYYVDFLVKYLYFDSAGEQQSFFECERLVLNKKGLVRIESIL
ncbi:MAG: hypothetical protein OXT67_04365 [Zetaproteobacteria bacterium]|nr:hypothetical protein [Zetaproteobacteria bacterium]